MGPKSRRHHGPEPLTPLGPKLAKQVDSEFRAFEELIPNKAADTRGDFPRLTLNLLKVFG